MKRSARTSQTSPSQRATRALEPGSSTASRPLLAAVCGIALLSHVESAFASEGSTPAGFDSALVTVETRESRALEADLPGEEFGANATAEGSAALLRGIGDLGGAPSALGRKGEAAAFRESDLEATEADARGASVVESHPIASRPRGAEAAGDAEAAEATEAAEVAGGDDKGDAGGDPGSNAGLSATKKQAERAGKAGVRPVVTVGPAEDAVHDVPYEILLAARNNFRALAGGTAGGVAVDERFVGSLLEPLSPVAPLFPGERAPRVALVPVDPRRVLDTDDDSAKLDSEKVYTVVDGRIVEVAQVDTRLDAPRADVKPPEGFVIAVEENGSRTTVTSEGKDVVRLPVEAGPGAAVAVAGDGPGAVGPGGTQVPAASSAAADGGAKGRGVFTVTDGARAYEDLLGGGRAASLASGAAGTTGAGGTAGAQGNRARTLLIPDALKEGDSLGFGEHPILDASATAGAAPRLVAVRGRVTVPAGAQASSVVLRIAGTGWQIQPDADGQFEFRDMPYGARFEILAWDVNNGLTRRMIPVTASGDSEVAIALQASSYVDDLATAFGVRQDNSLKGGFCATLGASNKDLLIGARVTVSASKAWQGPFYFNESRLPDASLSEASRDGRFCVFNVDSELVDVNVRLLNGARRSFTVHVKPTFFEAELPLEVATAAYRPAMPLELVDSFEAFESTSSSRPMRFGTLSTRKWLRGEESATWSRVYGLKLRTDTAYGPVTHREGDAGGIVYLPLGQEFQEIRFARDDDSALEAHALVSRSEILGRGGRDALARAEAAGGRGNAVVVDPRDPIALRVMDADTIEDLVRADVAVDADPSLGTAFVSIDLGRLEVDYADVRLSLRDVWSGRSMAPFHFVKAAPGSRNPRQVRGFFTNVPEGQYTLLVTDSKGALRWIDVVRARAGSLQVVSVGE